MSSVIHSEPPQPRVLVTGAFGFTGRYLTRQLEASGYRAVALERDAASHLDLRNADEVRQRVSELRPDFVVHLAAISFVGYGDAGQFYSVNTVGTDHLLAALAAEAPNLRKCVIASSANIYGNATEEPVTEHTAPAPVNHYACSKLAMEHIARTWFDRLPIVITRPFNYTGVGQSASFVVPKLVAEFARGVATLKLGNLDVVRDFSDVRTVADTYVRLLDRGRPGDVLNICSGHGRSLVSIIETLCETAGYRPKIETDPALVRRAELKRLVGSGARLIERIGPLAHANFDETLRWMLTEARAASSDQRSA